MAQIAVSAEVVSPAIRLVGSFLGGSVQRIGWKQSSALGYFTTGLVTVGAGVAAFMMDGIGQAAMEGLAASGASIIGWQMTEAFLLPAAAHGPAALGDGSRSEALAQRMRSRLQSGDGAHGRYPSPAREEEMAGVRLR